MANARPSDSPVERAATRRSTGVILPSMAAHTQPVLDPIRQHIPHPILGQHGQDEHENTKLGDDGQHLVETSPQLSPRHVRLQHSMQLLESQIAAKQKLLTENILMLQQHDATPIFQDDEATMKHATQIVAQHIKLLHQYNEIKDIGLGLMGLIADREGKRLGEVMTERDIDEKD